MYLIVSQPVNSLFFLKRSIVCSPIKGKKTEEQCIIVLMFETTLNKRGYKSL